MAAANSMLPETGQAAADHLYQWGERAAPDWLALLGRCWEGRDARARLGLLLRSGDAGLWLLPDETVARATTVALRRWMLDLIAGADELRWLSPGPDGAWSSVSAAALMAVLPGDEMAGFALVDALKPVLTGIGTGALDFGWGRRPVRVFRRSEPLAGAATPEAAEQVFNHLRSEIVPSPPPAVERSEPPPPPEEPAMPADGSAEGTTPAATSEVRSPEEAEAAYIERLANERASTGHAASRPSDYEWAGKQRPYHVTQRMIDLFREKYLTNDEKRGGRPRRG